MKPGRAGALLVLLAVVPLLPALAGGFILLDDPLYLLKNDRIQASGLAGLVGVWNPAAALRGEFVEFFPLRDSLYWLVWHAVGASALAFRLLNLALHAVAAVLVWRVARRFLPDSAAFFAAALWAVHPVHVESVAWVAALKDPLFFSLSLGALLVLLDARTWRSQLAGNALLVLALLTKSIAAMTPLALLLLLRFDGASERVHPTWRELARRTAIPFLLAGTSLVFDVVVARAAGVVSPLHGGSLLSHLTLTSWAQVRYAQQAFAPLTASLMYCFSPTEGLGDLRLWAGLVVAAGFVALSVRGGPLIRLLVGWHLVWLLPVSNVVPFPSVFNDRYLYASSLAACSVLALGVCKLQERWWRPTMVVVVTLAALFTAMRSADWRDEERLYVSSDEDPSCMTDPSTYGAKVHFQRAMVAPEVTDSLGAFGRAVTSAGFAAMTPAQRCGVWLQAANRAFRAKHSATAAIAESLVGECPHVSAGWYLGALAVMDRDPRLALERAHRARVLNAAADTLTLEALLLIDANEPGSDELFERALTLDAKTSCQLLQAWAARRSADLARARPLREKCGAQ